MPRPLFVAWQDPARRKWIPVGRLWVNQDLYWFAYTQGALASTGFVPFGGMSDLNKLYLSKELFPVFLNRIMSKGRPEYSNYLGWLNLADDEPIAMLGRTGGERETDSIILFPEPQRGVSGELSLHFFSHGLRYLDAHSMSRVSQLVPGEQLLLNPEPSNPEDPFAIRLMTSDGIHVGYCPRYLCEDIHSLIRRLGFAKIQVGVVRLNSDAPIQFRLLCQLWSPWPEDFQMFSGENYQPAAVTHSHAAQEVRQVS